MIVVERESRRQRETLRTHSRSSFRRWPPPPSQFSRPTWTATETMDVSDSRHRPSTTRSRGTRTSTASGTFTTAAGDLHHGRRRCPRPSTLRTWMPTAMWTSSPPHPSTTRSRGTRTSVAGTVHGPHHQHVISMEANSAVSVFAADLDGDLRHRCRFPRRGRTTRLRGTRTSTAAGHFGAQQVISTSLPTVPRSVFAADVDGDGAYGRPLCVGVWSSLNWGHRDRLVRERRKRQFHGPHHQHGRQRRRKRLSRRRGRRR